MFFFEFCEISKNTFFTEHIWATASEEHLPTAASGFLETALLEHSSHPNLAMGTFHETKIKGCSNQSGLNKNTFYHKVLGENRKDEILAKERSLSYWKNFHVKLDKKQKIFFYTPVSSFQ